MSTSPPRLYASWTDIALLEALALDNWRAFAELYERYWYRVFALAYRKLKSRETAEELVQELFAALWHKRAQQTIGQLEDYLLVAINHRVLTYIRAHRVRAHYADYCRNLLTETTHETEETLAAADLSIAFLRGVELLPKKSHEGKPFVKFQKYADDVRLKTYKNLGNSKREGMFLQGYLLNLNGRDTIKSTRGYNLYLRDQVGLFKYTKPNQVLANKTSDMNNADSNSGIPLVKYPFYPSSDPNKIEADYAEIRLAEVYYMLAECKFRAGDRATAAQLLNTVRRRNYPAGSASLYPAGGASLTEQELLDE